MKEEQLKHEIDREMDDIKPGGLTDGIMRDEAKTEIKNQKVSEDPATVNDILPKDPAEDITPGKEAAKPDESVHALNDEAIQKAAINNEDIKPGGLTDGMMRDETKTEIKNQKVSEDPATVNDIIPEDR